MELVNNSEHSDLQVRSKEGTLINLSTQMLLRGFLSQEKMWEFIEYLQLCDSSTCLELMQFVYLGMGDISEEIYTQFQMTGQNHTKTDTKGYFASITNKLRGSWFESKSLSLSTESSGVIHVGLEEWE